MKFVAQCNLKGKLLTFFLLFFEWEEFTIFVKLGKFPIFSKSRNFAFSGEKLAIFSNGRNLRFLSKWGEFEYYCQIGKISPFFQTPGI